LGRALRRIPAWAAGPVLIPDYDGALTALREHPGLPAAGVVAVCDFGGSATTLTLVDAADDNSSVFSASEDGRSLTNSSVFTGASDAASVEAGNMHAAAGGRGVLTNLDAVAAAVPSNVRVQGLVHY
jgi:hypothetical protein